jgi:hypothetical protein
MKPRVAAKRVARKAALRAQAARKRSAAPTIGKLVIFDSFMPHVVLPFKVKKKADRRISLVIHFNYRKHTLRNPFPHLEYWY